MAINIALALLNVFVLIFNLHFAYVNATQLSHFHFNKRPGPRLNIKTVFWGVGISIIKIRRALDSLIFTMGIPMLVRRHIYIETGPSLPSTNDGKTSIVLDI